MDVVKGDYVHDEMYEMTCLCFASFCQGSKALSFDNRELHASGLTPSHLLWKEERFKEFNEVSNCCLRFRVQDYRTVGYCHSRLCSTLDFPSGRIRSIDGRG